MCWIDRTTPPLTGPLVAPLKSFICFLASAAQHGCGARREPNWQTAWKTSTCECSFSFLTLHGSRGEWLCYNRKKESEREKKNSFIFLLHCRVSLWSESQRECGLIWNFPIYKGEHGGEHPVPVGGKDSWIPGGEILEHRHRWGWENKLLTETFTLSSCFDSGLNFYWLVLLPISPVPVRAGFLMMAGTALHLLLIAQL